MAQIDIETLIGRVAQRCMGAPLPTLIDAYLSAARELCRRSRYYTEERPVTTVASDSSYTLTPSAVENEIIGVRLVRLTISTNDIRDLTREAKRRWDDTDPINPPEVYDFEVPSNLLLHPTPAGVYTGTATVVLQPKLGSTTIDEDLVLLWDDAFALGALAELQLIPGQPYENLAKADMDGRSFQDWINKAKSAAAKKFQRGVTPY